MKKNNNKLYLFSLIFFSILFYVSSNIQAETVPSEISEEEREQQINEKLIDNLTLDEINDFWRQISGEYGEFVPEITTKSMTDLIKDNDSISLSSTVKGVVKYLLHELLTNGK